MLTARNIQKHFPGQSVLNGVDIDIKPGEITTLIGPSGSGKTTLLRALALIDPPDEGEISIDDRKYTYPFDGNEKREKPWPEVTVVFQQLFLWPHLTLRENILLPARNVNANAEEELAELVDILHMGEFINRYPNQASIGQRQRVALVRAILLHPKYILMDEITSALDVQQISRINSYLPTLKERNIGILIITHLINFAKRAADQVVFLHGGKIAELGSPDILDNPKSKELSDFISIIEEAT